MRGKVESLFGGPSYERTPNATCIATLERWLEMARSGEIIGCVVVGLYHDGATGWQSGGFVGGYSMLGATDAAHSSLLKIAEEG